MVLTRSRSGSTSSLPRPFLPRRPSSLKKNHPQAVQRTLGLWVQTVHRYHRLTHTSLSTRTMHPVYRLRQSLTLHLHHRRRNPLPQETFLGHPRLRTTHPRIRPDGSGAIASPPRPILPLATIQPTGPPPANLSIHHHLHLPHSPPILPHRLQFLSHTVSVYLRRIHHLQMAAVTLQVHPARAHRRRGSRLSRHKNMLVGLSRLWSSMMLIRPNWSCGRLWLLWRDEPKPRRDTPPTCMAMLVNSANADTKASWIDNRR